MIYLALEAIKKIRDTEEKAMEIIKKAQNDSNQIIKDSDVKAASEYKRILNEAKNEAKKILDDAAANAEKEAIPIIESGKTSAENIKDISKEKLEMAVNLVVERIVNINGNS
ncbi:ATPase [Clostridium sp.]|uniref:ATPase n=1 Tax=Clostridium sp. TaxID=1506 RepID=UPI0039F52243